MFFGLLFLLFPWLFCFGVPCFLVWFWVCAGSLDYVSVLASSTVQFNAHVIAVISQFACCNRTR